MSRRPLSNERFEQLRLAGLSQTEGYFEAITGKRLDAGRSATAPNGFVVQSSRHKDVFDEPSTGVRKKPTAKRPPNFKRALAEVTEYGDQVVKGLWECAEPRHLVGLYAALHAHLYGVPALELEQDYGGCLAAATKLVKDEFAGDCLVAQGYVAWCVARAKNWKKQKERDGEEVVRVGWRLLFKGRKWLVDWKASGRG